MNPLDSSSSTRSLTHSPTAAYIQPGLWAGHQSLLAACTEPILTPLILLHLPHYSIPVTITALIIITSFPAIFTLLTASDTPSYYLIESRLLSFLTAEEDLRIETSCPLNEATAVLMLKNLCYHHTSHSDEPLSYHEYSSTQCINDALK